MDTRPRSVWIRALGAAAAIAWLSANAYAWAPTQLHVGNHFQITDWTAGLSLNSSAPDVYSETGPIDNDTGESTLNGVTARARGWADFGSLGFYARTTIPMNNTAAGASGGASFRDTWTISATGLTGTPGSLNVWVDLEGTITGQIGHPGVYAGAGWTLLLLENYGSSVGSWDYSTNSGRQTYHGFLAQPVSFVYGQSFDFGIQLDVGAGGNQDSIADYYGSAVFNLSKSIIADADGSPVSSFELTAASGHDYLAPIPEPQTYVLMLAGAAFIGFAGGCRRPAHAARH